MALHCARQAAAERLCGELQWSLTRRVPQRNAVRIARPCPIGAEKLARRLEPCAAAQRDRRADARRRCQAACATPPGWHHRDPGHCLDEWRRLWEHDQRHTQNQGNIMLRKLTRQFYVLSLLMLSTPASAGTATGKIVSIEGHIFPACRTLVIRKDDGALAQFRSLTLGRTTASWRLA